MFPSVVMSNSTCLSEEGASVSSVTRVQDFCSLNPMVHTVPSQQQPNKMKKKRNLPGNPDPDAEVIALSPKTLLATNRFVCEICNKGFQRDQNLQLHRRGHNLPWKLKQRSSKDLNRKRAYVCPEPTCVHHHPSRALGDLTGIKKHYCRKHGEKKWKCDKCSKIYAVQSDWKAHAKTCGTREYRCDCGTLFSRKDSFITHRAFCDALAEESARLSANSLLAAASTTNISNIAQPFHLNSQNLITPSSLFPFSPQNQHDQQQRRHFINPPTSMNSINLWAEAEPSHENPNPTLHNQVNVIQHHINPEAIHNIPVNSSPFYNHQDQPPPPHQKKLIASPFQNLPDGAGATSSTLASPVVAHLSATALLQKASTMGARAHSSHVHGHLNSTMTHLGMMATIHGHVTTGVPPEFPSFPPAGNLASTCWQKSNRLTRDFLGLTGDQCGGGGNGNGSMRGMVSFTEGAGASFPTYERDLSVLKHHSFAFADPAAAASETWGNC